jgi:flagellum-specific peptidoglycan hydrolase FlgJ
MYHKKLNLNNVEDAIIIDPNKAVKEITLGLLIIGIIITVFSFRNTKNDVDIKDLKLGYITNDSMIYGYYTYDLLSDTTFHMIYPVNLSFLMPKLESDIDSIRFLDSMHINRYIGYSTNCKDNNLISVSSIITYAVSNYKPIYTDEYSVYLINSIKENTKLQKISDIKVINRKKNIKKDKKTLSLTKSVDIKSIIKDKKMLHFISNGRNLHNYTSYAIRRNYPPSVFIAMGALETGYEYSSLTKSTKNMGNIKCKCSWDKDLRKKHSKMDVCTGAYDKIEKDYDYYVKYPSKWESIRSKFELLDKKGPLKRLNSNPTPYQLVKAIHRSDYASDRNYDKKILSIIKSNDLTTLDDYINSGYIIKLGTFELFKPNI